LQLFVQKILDLLRLFTKGKVFMIVSHQSAVERASQAAVEGEHVESICFSLLSLAISDGLRNSPSFARDERQVVERAVTELASDFFSNPMNPDVFSKLQAAIEAWKNLSNG
jgi:hypothetical protein